MMKCSNITQPTWTSIAMMATMMFALWGCGDDTAATPSNNNLMENRTQGPTGNTNIPEGSKLEHVQESGCDPAKPLCIDDVQYDSSRQLKVRLLNEGKPIPNAQVLFSIVENKAAGSKLGSKSAATDSDGIAGTELNASDSQGTVRIQAATSDGTAKVEFLISVGPKGASSYRVDFTEIGDANPKDLKVFLYAEGTTCDLAKNDPPTAEKNDSTYSVSSNGDYPTVIFSDVANGQSFTVAARSFMQENEKVEVAFGCVESSEATRLVDGQPVNVTVPMVKHLPDLRGDYDVTHTFDLVGALPPTVQTVINLLDALTNDPGAFVVGCQGSKCPVETDGLIGIVVEFLPDTGTLGNLKKQIQDFTQQGGFIQDAAREALGDIIKDFLDKNAPSWLSNGFKISGDITKSLRRFRVNARLSILEQPAYEIDEATKLPVVGSDGTLTADWTEKPNKHIWEGITLYWAQGCDDNSPPDCGEAVQVSPQDASTEDVVEGVWGGSITDLGQLKITEHGLSLNYGNLILILIEQIAFPRIFGDGINSVEKMLSQLIDCQSVADSVGTAKGVVKSLCEGLQVQASSALRKYMSGLVAGGNDQFLIGTPAGKDCQVLSPDPSVYVGSWESAPYPYFERFGEAPPKMMQCEWEVKIKLSSDSGSEPVKIDGTFEGKRK